MHGLNQFPLANMGGVSYLLGCFTVTVNRSSVMSVQLGRGHFPIAGSFLTWKNKVCLGEGCAYVAKCSSLWNFRSPTCTANQL